MHYTLHRTPKKTATPANRPPHTTPALETSIDIAPLPKIPLGTLLLLLTPCGPKDASLVLEESAMELVVAAAVIVLEEDATVLKPTFVAVMIERVLVAVTTEADGLELYESYAVCRKGTSTNGKKGAL